MFSPEPGLVGGSRRTTDGDWAGSDDATTRYPVYIGPPQALSSSGELIASVCPSATPEPACSDACRYPTTATCPAGGASASAGEATQPRTTGRTAGSDAATSSGVRTRYPRVS